MNIYVSNLMTQVQVEELTQLFSNYGEVSSCKIIEDKFTGISRGFAFIEMPNNTDANKAMAALNGKQVAGRSIAVSEARSREDRAFQQKNY